MRTSSRTVLPELLDHLDPNDPQARRSRRDLQRVHFAMGTMHAMRTCIARLSLSRAPQNILELGAGDGTLLLRLARSQAANWPGVQLTLLDQHDLVSAQTRAAYEALGWRVSVLKSDVLSWSCASSPRYDLCVTTLFLHHFVGQDLSDILAAVGSRSGAFVACEPSRDAWTYLASRFIGFLGANQVTRSDAVSSVAAGFRGQELSQLWPDAAYWVLNEWRVLPFTHCFTARSRESLAAA